MIPVPPAHDGDLEKKIKWGIWCMQKNRLLEAGVPWWLGAPEGPGYNAPLPPDHELHTAYRRTFVQEVE